MWEYGKSHLVVANMKKKKHLSQSPTILIKKLNVWGSLFSPGSPIPGGSRRFFLLSPVD